ncbi:MAG TPA: hypothetical protein VLX92_31050 [Kofleriaceae bacterium]|nr:hypothetical protein [Kofleriaceae bacterium]
MRPLRACIVLASVVACGPSNLKHKSPVDAPSSGDGGTDAGHVLTGITITPTNPIVQLDLNATGAQGFTATAVYADGVDEDVSATATWNVMNPAVGTMTGSTLSIPAFTTANAVVSLITADYGGLTGQAQITVVAYRQSGTQQDFFFILPYNDAMGPVNKPLDFQTAVQALDVFFLMDTTGSMAGEIKNLQNALTGTVIPGIQAAVANTQFGVGALEDFPINPYGNVNCAGDGTDDQPFKLRQVITSNTAAVASAVNGLTNASGGTIGCGNDLPEGGIEAIYQAATGDGLTGPSPTNVPANHTGVGGVAFRQGTMPVIVAISDADSHDPASTASCSEPGYSEAEAYTGAVAAVAHSRAQTKTALGNICARLVGMAAIPTGTDPSCEAQSYFEDLATSTGARVPPVAWDYTGTRPAGCASGQCCTDFGGAGRAPDADGLCPVVFRVQTDGTGVSTSVVTGIQMLTRFATFTVTSLTMGVLTDINGVPLPTGHTTADFLKSIVPATFTLPPPPPVLPNPTFDTTTFYNVTPGTVVGFTVNAYNDFVVQTDQPQIFRATIQVLAGGCTPLDQRSVLILVPPMPITIE